MSKARPQKYRYVLFVTCAILSVLCAACERATELTFEDGDPSKFKMGGSGELMSLRFRGWHKQREALGETAFLYWVIEAQNYKASRSVEGIDTITYGQVPKGYIQVYPENGGPPPALNESETYAVSIDTWNAPGVGKRFKIRNGKIEEIPDPSKPVSSSSNSKQ